MRTGTFPRFAFVCVLAPLSACDDCGPEIIPIAPQIFVDVCATPQKTVGDKVLGGFTDCALDFGLQDISIRTQKTFTIHNPSSIDLDLISVESIGDPAFQFVNEPPESIPPGLSAQLAVTLRPTLESTITTDIVIISDARNTPQNADGNSEVVIPVTLTGVDNGVPDIDITPVDCGTVNPLGVDFGRVATGGITVCNLEVRNLGTRELFFDSVGFLNVSEPADSDAAPALNITGIIPTPDLPLRPTSAENPPLTLRLTFAPDVLGRFDGVIRIESSDPDEQIVDIPVQGLGVVGPTCVAKIKSVNDIPGSGDIEPLDDVVLTTEDSTPATPDGSIIATRWEIHERGPDSTVILSSPNTTDTGFVFANRRGVDVAGRYEACAVVTDDLNTDSQNRCCVAFEAIPSQSFLVQLTWAEPTGDMDLHVTKKVNGNYCVQSLGGGSGDVQAPFNEGSCNNSSCYFANCKPGNSSGAPEWDDVPGRTAGDPFLDIDDLTGFGPENINVDLAVPGSYGFGATTFSSVTSLMTIRLFVFGRLAGEWQDSISSDFWEVGLIHFTADNPGFPCVEDLTDGNPNDECPGF